MKYLTDILAVCGAMSVTAGVALFSIPCGLIVAGAFMIAGAWLIASAKTKAE